jgi:DNA-binding transcriptional LysR family regulator
MIALFENVKRNTVAGAEQLRLISGPLIIDALLGEALSLFRQTFPCVAVQIDVMPVEIACQQLLAHRADLLLFHRAHVVALPTHHLLSIEKLTHEPYRIVVREGHPILKTPGCLDDLLKFDWALAGVNDSFRALILSSPSLSERLRFHIEQNAFPKYQPFSQSACLALAKRSDVITVMAESPALELETKGEFRTLSIPLDSHFLEPFSIAAITTLGRPRSKTLRGFIEAIGKGCAKQSSKVVDDVISSLDGPRAARVK